MTVAFLEQRLDPHITNGAHGGPSVTGRMKTYLPGGKLMQSFNATMPIHKYDVSHGVKTRDDFQTVLDLFYIIMFTPYTGFRYKDWRDFIATQSNTTVTNISGSTWQLQRKHTFGGITFKRDIIKPCATPAIVVYDAGGTPLTATVDTTTGIATVTGTPASWTGEFDVPVTFTNDEWTSDLETASYANAVLTSNPIQLEEIRL